MQEKQEVISVSCTKEKDKAYFMGLARAAGYTSLSKFSRDAMEKFVVPGQKGEEKNEPS